MTATPAEVVIADQGIGALSLSLELGQRSNIDVLILISSFQYILGCACVDRLFVKTFLGYKKFPL
jgi:hypothetical protein